MQNQEANFEDMNTLSSLTNTAVKKGYTENFQVDESGLFAPSVDKHYHADKIIIDNFYRFEGASNPSDNAILYLLQTNDGLKGMLIDSYGAEADELISAFIGNVPEITKAEAIVYKEDVVNKE